MSAEKRPFPSRMTNVVAGLLLSLAAAGCATSPKAAREPFAFSSGLQDRVPFVAHEGEGKMQTYLAMNVAFPPADELRRELERRLGTTLLHRGEAHVTVITPVEYDHALRGTLTMKEISEIAGDLQGPAFEPVCVGRGSANLNGRGEQTYFVVLRAPKLLDVRRAVKDAFVKAGGSPSAFAEGNYRPHVTLGFTKRDLHEEDGVVKDETSCIADLVKAAR